MLSFKSNVNGRSLWSFPLSRAFEGWKKLKVLFKALWLRELWLYDSHLFGCEHLTSLGILWLWLLLFNLMHGTTSEGIRKCQPLSIYMLWYEPLLIL